MSENLNNFIKRDENCMVFTEKEYFFYFIVYIPMRASDVITNVTKQNMNIMASPFSATSSECRLYFISFGIIEPSLVILKIEYRLSRC